VGGQRHTPTALPLQKKKTGTHCVGGWVAPRAGVKACGISYHHLDSISEPYRPVESPYTYYATLAQRRNFKKDNERQKFYIADNILLATFPWAPTVCYCLTERNISPHFNYKMPQKSLENTGNILNM
jgi:hypothetical protein